MLKKALLASMCLTACGSETSTANVLSFNEFLTKNVPPIVRPHFVEFFEYCDISSEKNSDLCRQNIKFLSFELKQGPLIKENPDVIGLCVVFNDRKIYLRDDLYSNNSLTFKALVWHELGHCLLDLGHVPEADESSLMNPTIPGEYQVAQSWPYFVSNLFNVGVKVEEPTFTMHGRDK